MARNSSPRQPTDRPPDLVYTGQIRDKVTRRPINDVIYFLITDKRSGLDFPFVNDAPGHYRSPDVGASVSDLGRVTVDPSQLEIQVAVSGYKTQTLTSCRGRTGLVAVDFRMERDPAFGAPASGQSSNRAAPAELGLDRARRTVRGTYCRTSGANISPPSVHSALKPRRNRIGLCMPTFRSKISP